MPYLTLWDKIISQNLANLEANSHKIFKSRRIFRQSCNTFYEEINSHHTLLCLSQTSYIIIKAFDYFGGSFKVIFVKITEFYQISLKNLPHLTDFSPQLMACMKLHYGWCTGRRFMAATLHNTSCSEGKYKYKMRSLKSNENFHKKEDGLYRNDPKFSDRYA